MVEFIFFALILLGVAAFHKWSMQISLLGLGIILLYKLTQFPHFSLTNHLIHEWQILVNLLGLLLGFSILSKHFEESHIPEKLPKFLPTDWKGPLFLLAIVFVMSGFLDNIAAAMIGGAMAKVLFRGKVHIGFLAAIVAASNAGGAGSVLGDTTTTLMWIAGVSPFDVLHAYIGAIGAFLFFSVFAAKQQSRLQKIIKVEDTNTPIKMEKVFAVVIILILAVLTNWRFDFPALGVWGAILGCSFFCKTPWKEIKTSLSGTIFLLSLVMAASLMPVEKLPPASWQTSLILGFISSIFDNIPLTKLCLTQGGYDWGILAYAVGYGGSMIWFGSSAGVALSNTFPEIRSSWKYIKNGWHVIPAYLIGFFLLLWMLGWNPMEIS